VLLEHNLIKRVGTPEDIVRVALTLVSDAASYMTGANVVIDGGRTVW
jgi:2-dehydro-3-deoxy-D-gluconate 5-dehydrogenase